MFLDELVNLYKLANTQARNSNYEQILRILNDCLQGTAEGLGFVLGATPDTLLDTRRGLYSYAALQSRLAENTYASAGLVDYSGPSCDWQISHPRTCTYCLANFATYSPRVTPLATWSLTRLSTSFMAHCADRVGDAYFRTPRTTIKEFVNLLACTRSESGRRVVGPHPESRVLGPEQNLTLTPLAEDVGVGRGDAGEEMRPLDDAPPPAAEGDDDELSTLRL